MMTVGSLFSGIGGLELGLERAGMRTVWQVEKDEYCRRVLAKHWPDVARYEDVRDVGAHNLEPVDVVCGGFPCQDISNAGKRAGIDGERSGLWSEYARIIRELRPSYVLVENVAALLARGLERVLGDLAESGYDAEWDCIPAAAVGAPHRRDRLFVVAYARHGAGAPARSKQAGVHGPFRLPQRTEGSGAAGGRGAVVAHPDSPRLEGHGGSRVFGEVRAQEALGVFRGSKGREQWESEPNVGRVANGVPHRVDRLRALGNAVVPQVSEYIGHAIVAHHQHARRAA